MANMDERLESLRELSEEATPGIWDVANWVALQTMPDDFVLRAKVVYAKRENEDDEPTVALFTNDDDRKSEANALYAVSCVNYVREKLAEIERQKAERD